VLSRADQFPVGGVADAFVFWLKVSGEGALRGMLCFFLVVSPSALGLGTALRRFADEIGPVVPIFTFILTVPSFNWSGVGSGGIFGEAFLLWGFGIL
jgi:hypothetical protein